MSLSGGQLITDLHIKSTDKHQYLHYTSAHPDHTKRSIVFSQAVRVSRIRYNKTDFERHLDDMKAWFQAKSYPKYLAQKFNLIKKIAILNKVNLKELHITLC